MYIPTLVYGHKGVRTALPDGRTGTFISGYSLMDPAEQDAVIDYYSATLGECGLCHIDRGQTDAGKYFIGYLTKSGFIPV